MRVFTDNAASTNNNIAGQVKTTTSANDSGRKPDIFGNVGLNGVNVPPNPVPIGIQGVGANIKGPPGTSAIEKEGRGPTEVNFNDLASKSVQAVGIDNTKYRVATAEEVAELFAQNKITKVEQARVLFVLARK